MPFKKCKAPNSPLKSAIYSGNLQSFTLRGLFATKSVVFFGYKKGCLIFEHSIGFVAQRFEMQSAPN
jgi:hypothetical protein